jgi:hypothetical protein
MKILCLEKLFLFLKNHLMNYSLKKFVSAHIFYLAKIVYSKEKDVAQEHFLQHVLKCANCIFISKKGVTATSLKEQRIFLWMNVTFLIGKIR